MMPNPSRSMKTVMKMMRRGDTRRWRQRRRTTSGKLRQTGTPQKCVPSVQRGEIRPLRTTHGGPDVSCELRVLLAHLRNLVHRGEIDLLLGVEARAERPLVQEAR